MVLIDTAYTISHIHFTTTNLPLVNKFRTLKNLKFQLFTQNVSTSNTSHEQSIQEVLFNFIYSSFWVTIIPRIITPISILSTSLNFLLNAS